MTYYVAVLRDTLDNKKDFIALYAYDATSEVAFLNNMKYHYDYAMTEDNTTVYTDYITLQDENYDILQYFSHSMQDDIMDHMSGGNTEHFAVNFSVYKDK
jgi:hypothetical protein